ncbi:MAG: Na/Pi symporter [Bacteroidales bacterium]|nr:Na/Pi symporter [Bacteroidales bacterium]
MVKKLFYITYFILGVLLIINLPAIGSNHIINDTCPYIVKPSSSLKINYSGNNQYQTTNLKLKNPVRVKVLTNNNIAVSNFPVYFEKISKPKNSEGFIIHTHVAYTNSDGIAETYITLGSTKGEYEIIAIIKSESLKNTQIFKLYARKSNWVIMMIIGLTGGLGLFLFGINLMSKGMQRSAGNKMRTILSVLTNNRFIAIGVGIFVTTVIQSSSATTVMLVSFVYSGLMSFAQTVGIILGSGIGTTITAQIIAFKLTDYSLLLIGIGVLMWFLKRDILKNIGTTILGFGLLFFGMHIMSEAMYPLRNYPPFINILLKLEVPILGIIIGTIFTALIQSSSAFIGILIILSSQGLLSLEAAIPLLFGANIGTSITSIIASINTNREAKKVAFAHTSIKVLAVLLFVWWIPEFSEIVKSISPKIADNTNDVITAAKIVPRQIANAHTIFNVSFTLIMLPFTHTLVRIINNIFPEKFDVDIKKYKLKYIDDTFINTPALALNLSKQETLRMFHKVQNMVSDIIVPFLEKDKKILKNIPEKEEEINFLRDKIKSYLIKISKQNIEEERANEAFQIMYTIKELEFIADIVSKTLYYKANSWVSLNRQFSEQGKKEIVDYHLMAQKQISRAIVVFRDVNLKKAKAMKKKYKKYSNIAMEFERLHYERLLIKGGKSLRSSKTHLELISMLKIISEHATNIAKILLVWSEK